MREVKQRKQGDFPSQTQTQTGQPSAPHVLITVPSGETSAIPQHHLASIIFCSTLSLGFVLGLFLGLRAVNTNNLCH